MSNKKDLTVRICTNTFYSRWCEKFGLEAIKNKTPNDITNLLKVKEYLVIRTLDNEEKLKGYILCLSDLLQGEVYFVHEDVSNFIATIK